MGKFIIIVAIIGGIGAAVYKFYPPYALQREIESHVRTYNAELPKVYNNAVRMERLDYNHHVLRMTGSILASVDIDDSRKGVIQTNFKQVYCHGRWKSFADNKVPLELDFNFESPFYKGVTWKFRMSPQDCAAPSA